MAPLTMWEEKNTGTNLPAQIELYADTAAGHETEYKFLFMAKGGGSANKSLPVPGDQGGPQPDARCCSFLDEKLRSLGTAACPPYHLAVVIGGTCAEFALKTAKYASAHYLDTLPTAGSHGGHGFRDLELEAGGPRADPVSSASARSSAASTSATTCASSGCPATAPRCPVAIAVSCSADRQALGKITAEGVFLEQLETDPARFLPDVDRRAPRRTATSCAIDLNRPMAEILRRAVASTRSRPGCR